MKLIMSAIAFACAALTAQAQSLDTINDGRKAGKYQNYPVAGKPAPSNYTMANALTPGTALPRVVDAKSLAESLKDKKVHIISASADGVAVVPSVVIELARQNEMEPAAFLRYIVINGLGLVEVRREQNVIPDAARVKAAAEEQYKTLIAEQTQLVQNYATALGVANNQVQNLLLDNRKLREIQAALEADIARLTTSNTQLQAQLAQSQATVVDTQNKLDQARIENTKLTASLEAALARQSQLGEQLSQAQAAAADLQSKLSQSQSDNAASAAQNSKLQGLLEQTKTAGALLEQQLNQADQGIASLKASLSTASSTIATLETKLAQQITRDEYSFTPAQLTQRLQALRSSTYANSGVYSYFKGMQEGSIGGDPNKIAAAGGRLLYALQEGYRLGYADGYADGFNAKGRK